jgi:hypothetical protein
MDTETPIRLAAEKYHRSLQRSREYYRRNADTILARMKEKHHAKNPDFVPRPNRKRRVMSEATGGSSSGSETTEGATEGAKL